MKTGRLRLWRWSRLFVVWGVATLGSCGPQGDGTPDGTDGGDSDGTQAVCGGLADDGLVLGGGPANALGFPPPCDPSMERESGSAYTCCSDDPATLSSGERVFSGPNNAESRFGVCTRTEDIPAQGALNEPAGCPMPCNPTWPESMIAAVCGETRVCCQTQELQPEDCIADQTGSVRPVRGTDIPELTNWTADEHATHQAPGGRSCERFGAPGSEAWLECIELLSVADQRGFCMTLGAGTPCPHTAVSYIDACEAAM